MQLPHDFAAMSSTPNRGVTSLVRDVGAGSLQIENNVWGQAPEGYEQTIYIGMLGKAGWTWQGARRGNAAIDLWLLKTRDGGEADIVAEVMIWLGMDGNIRPIGSYSEPVGKPLPCDLHRYGLFDSIDGPAWPVYSFLLRERVESIDLDVVGFLQTLQSMGLIDPGLWLTSVEFGNEIESGGTVFAYPEVKIGRKPWDTANSHHYFPRQLSGIGYLSLDLAYRSEVDGDGGYTIVDKFEPRMA